MRHGKFMKEEYVLKNILSNRLGSEDYKIVQYLNENNISYIQGLTWTTDAIFRETAERIAQRKTDGAKIVEMEQSGCIAVAQYRGFDYGALIYGGDDVSQEEWSIRGWRSREGIRYDLVMLCKELVNVI